uniref:Uncharacterized protein n=1 Tax=Rhodnius prolixus TaxID=13249 RepID=T1I206_RHOPR
MNDCVTTVQSNKSQVLRINPNNVKIIQNIKGCNNSVIISTSQIGGSPRINDGNGKKLGQQNTSSSQNKPHILPLIKQESDILVKNELNVS